jgi:MYXO-CTERM domain-containing protein
MSPALHKVDSQLVYALKAERGAAGEAGSAGEGGEGAVRPPRPPVVTRTGCNCEVGTEGDPTSQAWLAALALGAVALRRRGRRSLRAG